MSVSSTTTVKQRIPTTRAAGSAALNRELLTDDFKAAPYWWDASPQTVRSDKAIPDKCDVAIIGSGYTGLCAALELSANGRQCLVLDASEPGAGCSTRNGGQISSSIKPGYAALSRRYGTELAAAIMNAGHDGLFWIEEFINSLGIDCAFDRCGRFYGAHSAKYFKTIDRKLLDQPPGVSLNAEVVPASEQHRYIGSDHYHGGIVYHDHCSLDPGRYHQGLLNKAESLGAEVMGNARVIRMQPVNASDTSSGFSLTTTRGTVQANEVIVATNGYSDDLFPWTRKRVIPIGSYMIATEELPTETVERLIPQGRIITDSRKLVVYYRPSTDGKRILFGARVSISETDPLQSAPALHQQLSMRFPELESAKVSHSWMGFVAYTFDDMPHFGKQDGIHYAMGYCGSGVSLSSYSGVQIARQLMGKEFNNAFEQTDFQQRFYYRRHPWFLSPSIAWFKVQDALFS